MNAIRIGRVETLHKLEQRVQGQPRWQADCVELELATSFMTASRVSEIRRYQLPDCIGQRQTSDMLAVSKSAGDAVKDFRAASLILAGP